MEEKENLEVHEEQTLQQNEITEGNAEQVTESVAAEEISQEETKAEGIAVEKPEKKKKEKPAKKTRADKKAEKEAAREAEFAGLSDDELYTKIQTEKLLKRKKKNKIVTLIALCFAFVIVVSVIVMAVVPVSLKPKCMESGFSRVRIYNGTVTNPISFYADSEGYEKFEEVYDEAFEQTYINALFTGTLFSYDIEEKYDDVPSLSTLTSNGTYIVELEYAQDQVLTYQNGAVYDSVYETKNWTSSKLTFRKVWFNVSKESGMQKTTIYIEINNYPGSNSNTGFKTSNNLIKITTKGNTKLIYDAYDQFEDLYYER